MCGMFKVCKDHDAGIALGIDYNIYNSCMPNYGDFDARHAIFVRNIYMHRTGN